MDESTPWKREAECRSMNAALFFPESGTDCGPALQVCGVCPVRNDCLDHALLHGERDGIWGGTTGRQRRRMRSATIVGCRHCGRSFLRQPRRGQVEVFCSQECREAREAARKLSYEQTSR